jgi:adenine-specific DNA methylase
MTDKPRLIEYAFPLKQTSLDSVHEKNVRHGHISTLHIWPARRPLAACRAALIATLLPDPSAEAKPEEMNDDAWQKEIVRRRQELCEKIAGKVVKRVEKKKMPGGQVVEREKEETEGGILHWGRETENSETLEWFRQEIRKAYGGRAPKVLDPFAGGGAIPLEAMRLGCEATAIDINPVAWFILKCTLEYPQKLAGQKRLLPTFILRNRKFMEAYFKAQGLTKATIRTWLARLTERSPDVQKSLSEDADLEYDIGDEGREVLEADLAWHVRAWGQWVLDRARRDLAKFYPVYADFEPLEKDKKSYEQQSTQLVPPKDDGTPGIEGLNAEFGADYLAVKSNPRWVAKPTIAYLWARTVICKNCRATIPLLKTRWLNKKDNKRVLLTMQPSADRTCVLFAIETDVPIKGGNAAQRREQDKRLGAGTMTRAGADCPCCGLKGIMTMEDIRVRGRAKELGAVMTSVVVDGPNGKEYRLPTDDERAASNLTEDELALGFNNVPFGIIDDPIAGGDALGMRVPLYGFTRWHDLFSRRQLRALGGFVMEVRNARQAIGAAGYSGEWVEALCAMLAIATDRTANYLSTICIWDQAAGEVKQTFLRFALPITWDYAEANPLSEADRYFNGGVSCVVRVLHSLLPAVEGVPVPSVRKESAIAQKEGHFDLIVTDPPYYDAIPYSDLMDFFYVWLRRTLSGVSSLYDNAFADRVGPKWDRTADDGELIDDASRFDGDAAISKQTYEDGMFRAFKACSACLTDTGRLVIVFANKQPDAWGTLVSALIRAGFIVDGSWPIVTEMRGGVRNFNRASLASSVWLVCKARPATARPGWDNKVLDEMRANIGLRLREFWDAGIRGPDFVWAATGPALEAYSKHPIVKMADDPGQTLTVTEFLNHARRMVVDFVVGRVLGDGNDESVANFDRLDEPTAYYLLHRNDFKLDEAPAGACILYATACGLSDQELVRDWDLLVKTGGDDIVEDDADDEEPSGDDEPVEENGSGSKVKLKAWNQRRGRSLGIEAPGGRPVPLIDRLHRLMHLWKAGDVHKIDDYLDEHGLRRHELFRRVLQSLIELADHGGQERSLLESLSNHIGAKGAKKRDPQKAFALDDE